MLERIPSKLLQVASRQTGLAVWLWGEAGVGKSYALEGLLKSLSFRTLRLSPHLDLGRLLLSLPETPVPAWLEHTQARLKRGETVERAALLQALCAALEALGPVVVAVEDLPSAPLENREGWNALALRMGRLKGVALLVTGREAPPNGWDAGWDSVRLEVLTQTQTHALLEGQVGAALPSEAGNWVYTRSGGNPALTLELFRFLVQGGSLHSDGTRWQWRVPPEGRVPIGVEALLLERVRPLRADPALERVLLAHALLPEAPEKVQELAGLPPEQWEAHKAQLEREGLLRDGLFTLPMLAGVLSQSLSAADRTLWARERIQVLCQDPPDYLAAVRGLADAWLEPPQTQDLLRGAAEQAEARGYRGRAAELWTEVLRWVAPEERLGLTRRVAWLLREVQPLEALRHITRVTALVPDDGEALLLEAELLALCGRSSEAESRLRGKPELEGRWQERLLGVRYRLDDMAGVVALYEHNPALLERGVAVQIRVGYALGRQGRYGEALTVYQQALEQPNEDPLERAWLLSAFAALEFEGGELERSIKHFGQALDKLAGHTGPEAEKRRTVALYNRSQALYRLRRLPEATQDLEAALERLTLSGDGEGVAEAQVNLALFYLMGAHYRTAEGLLSAARPTLERSESAQSLLRLETALLQLYLEEGGEVGKRVAPLHLHRALALLPAVAPLEQAPSLYFVGWAEAVYGNPETAQQHAQSLADLCENHALPALKPAVDAILGHALERRGDLDAALEHFTAACEGYLQLGQPDWADRFGLEVDRLGKNVASAASRLERLNAAGLHSWVERGYRAFPQLQTLRELLAEVARPRPEKTLLEGVVRLEVLGSLRLFSSGKPLTPPAEQGRRLLLLLLEARVLGREGVRVLDLLESLYPAQDEERAENALKQLVYRLRGVLGKGAVLRLRDRYALGALSSDAESFLDGGPTRLWRGPALEDFAEDEGAALRDLLHDQLTKTLPTVLERDPTEGLRLLELLLEARPYDEALLELAAGRLERRLTGEVCE